MQYDCLLKQKGNNRTFVVLKWLGTSVNPALFRRNNRTFVVLKCEEFEEKSSEAVTK